MGRGTLPTKHDRELWLGSKSLGTLCGTDSRDLGLTSGETTQLSYKEGHGKARDTPRHLLPGVLCGPWGQKLPAG